MEGFGPAILIEGLLFGGGALAFYLWQMRSLKRDQAETARRRAQEQAASPAEPPPQ
jgi:hypothetical protein